MAHQISGLLKKGKLLLSVNHRMIPALIIAAVLLTVPVTADVIFAPQNLSIRIAGTTGNPDYLILAFPLGYEEEARVVPEGEDFRLGYEDSPGLYAVRQTDYQFASLATRESRRAFFQDKTRAIPSSGFRTYFFDAPPEDMGIRGVSETYRIVSLNATCLALERTGRVFRYSNGTEVAVNTGEAVHHRYIPWWLHETTQTSSVPGPATPVQSMPAITPAATPGETSPAIPVQTLVRTTHAGALSVIPVIGCLGIVMFLLMRRS